MAEVWIQSLVRELKSHKLSSMAKNKNRRFFKSRILQTLDLGHIGLGQSFVFLKKKKVLRDTELVESAHLMVG